MSTLMNQKLDLIQRHPFHLALESIDSEPGFVTEKVFQVNTVAYPSQLQEKQLHS